MWRREGVCDFFDDGKEFFEDGGVLRSSGPKTEETPPKQGRNNMRNEVNNKKYK